MNSTFQSETHPNAESLTAFAEQLLPAGERDQILAHLGTCGRCREVVFLAQKAIEEDQPKPVPALEQEPTPRRASWFNGWRWAWIPVAALAAFIGIALLLHFRHSAQTTQMAVNNRNADALRSAEATKTAPATTTASSRPEPLEPAKPTAKRDDDARQLKMEESRQLDQKKSIEPSEFAITAGAAPGVQSPQPSAGSIHEMIAARAKSAPTGGPVAADRFQQQNSIAQTSTQQDAVMQAPYVAAPAPYIKAQAPNVVTENKNLSGMPSASPLAASETATVQAQVLPIPASAASTQFSSVQLPDNNNGALRAATATQKKMLKITLPSGLGVLSVASGAERSVALDTAGAIFVSQDGGKLWQPVQAQWTGRAILVRTRPDQMQNSSLRARPITRFELVNDKLQTWLSNDGKTWIPQALPATAPTK